MATLGSRRGGERRTFRAEGEEEPERDEEEESKRVLQIEEELDPRIRSRKRGLSIYVHAEPHVGRRLGAHNPPAPICAAEPISVCGLRLAATSSQDPRACPPDPACGGGAAVTEP